MKPKVSEVLDKTTTVLGDGLTYTGAQFETTLYASLIISCFANRDGTLYIDQMHDGTNYDVITSIPYTASTTLGYVVPVVGNAARLRFQNSAGAANTTFRLSVRGRRN